MSKIREGWLHKKGHIFSNWRKRFFVLEGGTLSYFQKLGDAKPKGVIRLTGATISITNQAPSTGSDADEAADGDGSRLLSDPPAAAAPQGKREYLFSVVERKQPLQGGSNSGSVEWSGGGGGRKRSDSITDRDGSKTFLIEAASAAERAAWVADIQYNIVIACGGTASNAASTSSSSGPRAAAAVNGEAESAGGGSASSSRAARIAAAGARSSSTSSSGAAAAAARASQVADTAAAVAQQRLSSGDLSQPARHPPQPLDGDVSSRHPQQSGVPSFHSHTHVVSDAIRVFTGTWNMAETAPPANVVNMLPPGCDIYAVGLQESMHTDAVLAALRSHLGPTYLEVHHRVGSTIKRLGFHGHIALAVYVSDWMVSSGVCRISRAVRGAVALGRNLVVTRAANKGAVAIALPLRLPDGSGALSVASALVFLSCHLTSDAAGSTRLNARNKNAEDMLAQLGLDLSEQAIARASAQSLAYKGAAAALEAAAAEAAATSHTHDGEEQHTAAAAVLRNRLNSSSISSVPLSATAAAAAVPGVVSGANTRDTSRASRVLRLTGGGDAHSSTIAPSTSTSAATAGDPLASTSAPILQLGSPAIADEDEDDDLFDDEEDEDADGTGGASSLFASPSSSSSSVRIRRTASAGASKLTAAAAVAAGGALSKSSSSGSSHATVAAAAAAAVLARGVSIDVDRVMVSVDDSALVSGADTNLLMFSPSSSSGPSSSSSSLHPSFSHSEGGGSRGGGGPVFSSSNRSLPVEMFSASSSGTAAAAAAVKGGGGVAGAVDDLTPSTPDDADVRDREEEEVDDDDDDAEAADADAAAAAGALLGDMEGATGVASEVSDEANNYSTLHPGAAAAAAVYSRKRKAGLINPPGSAIAAGAGVATTVSPPISLSAMPIRASSASYEGDNGGNDSTPLLLQTAVRDGGPSMQSSASALLSPQLQSASQSHPPSSSPASPPFPGSQSQIEVGSSSGVVGRSQVEVGARPGARASTAAASASAAVWSSPPRRSTTDSRLDAADASINNSSGSSRSLTEAPVRGKSNPLGIAAARSYVIVFGDLNYRVELESDDALAAIVDAGRERWKQGREQQQQQTSDSSTRAPPGSSVAIAESEYPWRKLLRREQLRHVLRFGDAFSGYAEPPLTFPPSYRRKKSAVPLLLKSRGDLLHPDLVRDGFSTVVLKKKAAAAAASAAASSIIATRVSPSASSTPLPPPPLLLHSQQKMGNGVGGGTGAFSSAAAPTTASAADGSSGGVSAVLPPLHYSGDDVIVASASSGSASSGAGLSASSGSIGATPSMTTMRTPSYTDRCIVRQPLLAGVPMRIDDYTRERMRRKSRRSSARWAKSSQVGGGGSGGQVQLGNEPSPTHPPEPNGGWQQPPSIPSLFIPYPCLRCVSYDECEAVVGSDHVPVGAVWDLPLELPPGQAVLAPPGRRQPHCPVSAPIPVDMMSHAVDAAEAIAPAPPFPYIVPNPLLLLDSIADAVATRNVRRSTPRRRPSSRGSSSSAAAAAVVESISSSSAGGAAASADRPRSRSSTSTLSLGAIGSRIRSGVFSDVESDGEEEGDTGEWGAVTEERVAAVAAASGANKNGTHGSNYFKGAAAALPFASPTGGDLLSYHALSALEKARYPAVPPSNFKFCELEPSDDPHANGSQQLQLAITDPVVLARLDPRVRALHDRFLEGERPVTSVDWLGEAALVPAAAAAADSSPSYFIDGAVSTGDCDFDDFCGVDVDQHADPLSGILATAPLPPLLLLHSTHGDAADSSGSALLPPSLQSVPLSAVPIWARDSVAAAMARAQVEVERGAHASVPPAVVSSAAAHGSGVNASVPPAVVSQMAALPVQHQQQQQQQWNGGSGGIAPPTPAPPAPTSPRRGFAAEPIGVMGSTAHRRSFTRSTTPASVVSASAAPAPGAAAMTPAGATSTSNGQDVGNRRPQPQSTSASSSSSSSTSAPTGKLVVSAAMKKAASGGR